MNEFIRLHHSEPVIFFMDTAYTEKSNNDPTGIIATCKIGNDLYIIHGEKVRKEFPDLIRFIPNYVKSHGYTAKSTIRIEPKANGLSVIQQLKETTGLNVTKTPTPRRAKKHALTRLHQRLNVVELCWSMVRGIQTFIDEVCGFPSKPHDEYVDILCYAIDYHL